MYLWGTYLEGFGLDIYIVCVGFMLFKFESVSVVLVLYDVESW